MFFSLTKQPTCALSLTFVSFSLISEINSCLDFFFQPVETSIYFDVFEIKTNQYQIIKEKKEEKNGLPVVELDVLTNYIEKYKDLSINTASAMFIRLLLLSELFKVHEKYFSKDKILEKLLNDYESKVLPAFLIELKGGDASFYNDEFKKHSFIFS